MDIPDTVMDRDLDDKTKRQIEEAKRRRLERSLEEELERHSAGARSASSKEEGAPRLTIRRRSAAAGSNRRFHSLMEVKFTHIF